MVKTMTRKGLAVIAASSLAVVGLGTPSFGAQADTTKVSIAPTSGTATNVIAGALQEFSLTANEAVSVEGGDLSFLIESSDVFVKQTVSTGVTSADAAAVPDDWTRNADGVVTVETADASGIAVGTIFHNTAGTKLAHTGDDDVAAGYYVVTAVDTASTPETFSFLDGGEAAVTADTSVADTPAVADFQFLAGVSANTDSDGDPIAELVVDSGEADASSDETLVLIVNDSETATATVTAWVDDNNNGEIDSTEYASPATTFSFLGADDLTPTISWDAAFGVAAVEASYTFAEDLNWESIGTSELQATFSNAAGDTGLGTDGTFTEADGTITFADAAEAGTPDALEAGYLTSVLKNEDGDTVSTDRLRIEDLEIDDFEITVETGANVAQAATDGDVTLREDVATSLNVSIAVVDSDDVGIAGATVTVSDGTGSSLDSDADVTVGGEEVDATDSSFDDVTLTTNSAGVATLVINSADATDADSLDLDFSSQGVDDTVVFTWAAAEYSFFYLPNIPADDASAETTLWLGEGNSTDISFVAYDQWGIAPPAGDFRVETTIDQNDAAGDALDTVTKFANFNGAGQASVAVSDEAESGNDVTAALELQGYDADGDTWSDTETVAGSIGTDGVDSVTLTFTTGENEATNVIIDDDAPAAVDTSADPDLVDQAWYLGDTDQTPANGVQLSGNVEIELDGSAYAGGMVTISGSSDLLFGNTNGDADTFAYSYGSMTAVLDETGEFDFTAYSNVSGEFTVTITAGGSSETATVEFNAITDDATTGLADATVDIDAPSYVQPGSTLIATVTLRDQFGNPVEASGTDVFTVSWDGPGLISGSLPTETNANGEARVYILFGQNETGSGTLTVTYQGEDNTVGTTAADLDNVVVQKTVSLGTDYGTMSAWTVDQGDGTAKVYVKFPTIGEKVRIGHQTGGSGSYETIYVKTTSSETMDGLNVVPGVGTYVVRTIDLADGTNRIRVTVGDSTEVQVRYNE